MRMLAIIALAMVMAGCAGSKKTSDPTAKLNGSWVPVQEEFAGAPLPAPALEHQKLNIIGANYTMVAESTDKGTIKYSGADKMDIYGKEGVNAGKHFMAIYKYEKHRLTICYNLMGDGYPQSYDTKDKAMFFLCVFKHAD